MKQKNIFLILTLILASSCSTQLKYHMNNHKFLTPETKGEFLKGDISLSYQQTQKAILAEAFNFYIFNSSVNTLPSMSRSSSVDIPIDLGLFRRLDFFTLDSKYGLKYQFWGAPENEKAIDYKAALSLAYGYDDQNSSDVTYTSGSTSRTYSTKMKVSSYDASLLLGYRFSELQLIYVNLFRDSYKYKGTLSSNQFATVNASGESYNQGALLGFHFTQANEKRPLIAKLEIGVADAKLDNKQSITVGTYGADLGWSW